MKKIFNLAVILASLMGTATFTSCDDDEEKVIDNFENGDVVAVTELQVEAGKSYQAYQEGLAAFTFNVKSTTGTLAGKDQAVTFVIENADGKKNVEFTLSDKGTSYLMKNADGTFTAVGKTIADEKENAPYIVMVLASANSTKDFTITSGTVNSTLKANGAKETKFAEKK